MPIQLGPLMERGGSRSTKDAMEGSVASEEGGLRWWKRGLHWIDRRLVMVEVVTMENGGSPRAEVWVYMQSFDASGRRNQHASNSTSRNLEYK